MQYTGKLYAKINGHYLELNNTSSDFDKLEQENIELNKKNKKLKRLIESITELDHVYIQEYLNIINDPNKERIYKIKSLLNK